MPGSKDNQKKQMDKVKAFFVNNPVHSCAAGLREAIKFEG
jgi:hypothetical protein